jgi:hypothetical protein
MDIIKGKAKYFSKRVPGSSGAEETQSLLVEEEVQTANNGNVSQESYKEEKSEQILSQSPQQEILSPEEWKPSSDEERFPEVIIN